MKKYAKPDIKVYKIDTASPMAGSPEEYKEHIDGPGDWGDPIIDPDDEIEW